MAQKRIGTKTVYIGDSVYLDSENGFDFVIYTFDGITRKNPIHLDVEALTRMVKVLEKINLVLIDEATPT